MGAGGTRSEEYDPETETKPQPTLTWLCRDRLSPRCRAGAGTCDHKHKHVGHFRSVMDVAAEDFSGSC